MPEDITFLDLVALTRIKDDTVVEKFGGLINSSFFDASNILATLKQKGLVDFTTAFPGQSSMVVTQLGKQLLAEAEDKGKTEFDHLDLAILTQLSNGKRSLQDLTGAVNVRPRDLGLHLYKLNSQQFLSYELRNGALSIALTEKGFLQVKQGMPQPAGAPPMGAVPGQPAPTPGLKVYQPQQEGMPGAPQPAMPPPVEMQEGQIHEVEAKIKQARLQRLAMSVITLVIIIAIIAALVLKIFRYW